ncbi:3-methyl-2-oxobutanoate hydroxymethyltransferase [[Limnothrix rosea] IAM M-220]|uniref:3-methyl-2-oxobutanoate hydroxymethyltransferase n=1 Tax=[Limnothrix rosea] IAM M-220 TaxID=454133 RepID=UPI00095D9447|nr:3-methyl-2-oxobutanoate hydroxymethyltransferase [[Limnothrix rosea] IAM M-220]OKH19208.1 3-methyl-2-oxobutanoate hydroxymethyltransferase [[Limnothrix rosea] IAM M-220]
MRVTPRTLKRYKQEARPIVTLTAWDYAIARLVDLAGVDVILVGDSLAMVALGYENTLPISLDAMIHHTQAVCRGVHNALVVSDLPFLTYQESISQAIHTAGRILKETSAQAIKLEGGHPAIAETVDRLTMLGVPVMGHVGLTPQSVHTLGYRQQGKNATDAERVMNEAIALEQAGAFAVVLEHIPTSLAQTITQKLSIPTIGIGAGAVCDGQVLVTADLLGLSPKSPPFAKQYLNLAELITDAIKTYSDDVRQGEFPANDA